MEQPLGFENLEAFNLLSVFFSPVACVASSSARQNPKSLFSQSKIDKYSYNINYGITQKSLRSNS